MEKPSYVFDPSENYLRFDFESISNNKSIKKVVLYVKSPDDDIFYQLIFDDLLADGKVDVTTKSNDNDRDLVLITVVQTILIFFEHYPDKTIPFTGSTSSRTRIYQTIIAKLVDKSELYYDIRGFKDDGSIEKYEKNQNYDGFLIAKKHEKQPK